MTAENTPRKVPFRHSASPAVVVQLPGPTNEADHTGPRRLFTASWEGPDIGLTSVEVALDESGVLFATVVASKDLFNKRVKVGLIGPSPDQMLCVTVTLDKLLKTAGTGKERVGTRAEVLTAVGSPFHLNALLLD
jgi:hypothetical protein